MPENEWHIANVHEYFTEKAIPQIQELIEQYDPALMWFDTAFWAPPEVTIRALEAARKAKPDLIVNSRAVIGGKGNYGDYASTSDKPAVFFETPGDWECIPTTNESYGYHQTDKSHKPASHFVGLLVNAAARGGNLLMNLGPKGDGSIDPIDLEILQGIGEWTSANGEAIYGSTRTTLPVQAWGQSTRKGNTLYLHVFDWPSDGQLVLGGLKSDIKSASLLADANSQLNFERLDESAWVIKVPSQSPTPPAGVVVIEVADAEAAKPHRLIQPKLGVNTLHTFDGELIGKTIKYGKGHSDDDYLERWTRDKDGIEWPVRVLSDAKFEVVAKITCPKDKTGGAFVLTLAGQTLEAQVPEGKWGEPVELNLGAIELPAGRHTMTITPSHIEADKELMWLHEIRLVP